MVPLVGPGFKPTDRDEIGLWHEMERVEEEIAGSNLLIDDPNLTGYLQDLIGTVGAVLAASLLVAYAVLGLAVVHATTRGLNGRSFVLAGIYASVAVFGWPALLLSVLGLVDLVVDFRRRVRRHRLPDTST